MSEIIIKVEVPEKLKEEFELALARIVKDFVARTKLEAIKTKLDSKEEQELIRWSVELGRKAKKGRFRRLLDGLPAEERTELSL